MIHPSANSIVSIYRKHAKDWAALRSTNLVESAWLDRFLQLLPAEGAVLDIGCGPGRPIARYVVDQGRSLTGVDAAPEMIEMFQSNVPEAKAVVADMRHLNLMHEFDGIIAWDSFFHLTPDDQRAMFAVFDGHASPTACLLFNTGHKHGDAIGEFAGEPLYHSNLDAQEYTKLLHAHGFSVIKHVENDAACGGRTVWLAQRSGDASAQF